MSSVVEHFAKDYLEHAKRQAAVPEWKQNPAFADACASLGVEQPPELLKAEEPEESHSELFGRMVLQNVDPLEKAVEDARLDKQEANESLRGGDAEAAQARYELALETLEHVKGRARQVLLGRRVLKENPVDTPLSLAAEESLVLRAECRLNLAAARLKLQDPKGALKACEAFFGCKDAPESNARLAKGHFRMAQALERLGRLREAEGSLRRALERAPTDRGIGASLRRVRAERERLKANQKPSSFKGVFEKKKPRPRPPTATTEAQTDAVEVSADGSFEV